MMSQRPKRMSAMKASRAMIPSLQEQRLLLEEAELPPEDVAFIMGDGEGHEDEAAAGNDRDFNLGTSDEDDEEDEDDDQWDVVIDALNMGAIGNAVESTGVVFNRTHSLDKQQVREGLRLALNGTRLETIGLPSSAGSCCAWAKAAVAALGDQCSGQPSTQHLQSVRDSVSASRLQATVSRLQDALKATSRSIPGLRVPQVARRDWGDVTREIVVWGLVVAMYTSKSQHEVNQSPSLHNRALAVVLLHDSNILAAEDLLAAQRCRGVSKHLSNAATMTLGDVSNTFRTVCDTVKGLTDKQAATLLLTGLGLLARPELNRSLYKHHLRSRPATASRPRTIASNFHLEHLAIVAAPGMDSEDLEDLADSERVTLRVHIEIPCSSAQDPGPMSAVLHLTVPVPDADWDLNGCTVSDAAKQTADFLRRNPLSFRSCDTDPKVATKETQLFIKALTEVHTKMPNSTWKGYVDMQSLRMARSRLILRDTHILMALDGGLVNKSAKNASYALSNVMASTEVYRARQMPLLRDPPDVPLAQSNAAKSLMLKADDIPLHFNMVRKSRVAEEKNPQSLSAEKQHRFQLQDKMMREAFARATSTISKTCNGRSKAINRDDFTVRHAFDPLVNVTCSTTGTHSFAFARACFIASRDGVCLPKVRPPPTFTQPRWSNYRTPNRCAASLLQSNPRLS